ncbi:MAG: hypothetical protein A2X41_07155 [Candidatus Margulisbacteria bacterium GWE2_39_32]|nr:MAG: hypothetical protein A2X41_07155 [Candidatus Margulisbacteria bacterium GWE2_39_32]
MNSNVTDEVHRNGFFDSMERKMYAAILVLLVSSTLLLSISGIINMEKITKSLWVDMLTNELNHKMAALKAVSHDNSIEAKEKFLADNLHGYKFKERGFIYVMGSDGLMIDHPTLEVGFDGNEHAWTKYMLKNKNGYTEYTFNGVNKSMVFSYLPEWDWYLCLTITNDVTGKATNQFIKTNIGILLLVVVIGLIFIYFMLSKSLLPLKQITRMLKEIANGDGDLTKRIEINSKDEFGDMATYFNRFIDTIQEMVKGIKIHANKVQDFSKGLVAAASDTAEGITQINKAMENVSKGTSEQTNVVRQATVDADKLKTMINSITIGAEKQTIDSAQSMDVAKQTNIAMSEITGISSKQIASVELVKNIVSQMSSAVDQAASDAGKAAENSKQTKDIALNGEQIIGETVNGMDKIKEKVMATADKINELGKNSTKIGEIINVIDDISEQTNLLALNAAIEAARAGDHGRGFAVVADEVRKLAEKSSKATKEIANLIKNIQEATSTAVTFMNEGTAEVHNGSTLVNQAKLALTNIIDAVKDTVNQIENISAATEEMAASSNEVVDNVKKLAELTAFTNSSVALVEEASAGLVVNISAVDSVAKENADITHNMKDKVYDFSKYMGTILNVSEANASVTEEVTASAEEISAIIHALKESSVGLVQVSNTLIENMACFKTE